MRRIGLEWETAKAETFDRQVSCLCPGRQTIVSGETLHLDSSAFFFFFFFSSLFSWPDTFILPRGGPIATKSQERGCDREGSSVCVVVSV